MDILSHSPLVQTNFVLRGGYKTGSQNEFVKNIKENDFTLCPKGDGNYSARFYETLSLGCLPVLIDTECVLPLEDEINYNEFVVRVPHAELQNLPDLALKFYDSLTTEQFMAAQKKARETFEKYLNIGSFFKHVLTKEFLHRYE